MASSQEETGQKIKHFIYKSLLKDHNDIVAIHEQKRDISNPDQIKEIVHLFEHCCDGHPFEANSISCKLLLKLCRKNILQKEYLLKKLLTLSATTSNLVCIISTVWEIITFEMEEQLAKTGSYACPYMMRSPPHPLVTIMQQRPDACDVIINEVKLRYILAIENSLRILPHLLNALKPLLTFVFLYPARTTRSWEVQSFLLCLLQLVKTLFDNQKELAAVDIAQYLFKMAQCRKTTGSLVSDNALLTEQLASCMLELPDHEQVSHLVVQIGHHVISQCHKLIDANRDIFVHLNLLQNIFFRYPKGFMSDEFLYLLALLQYRSPTIYLERILKLTLYVIPCYKAYRRSSNILKSFVLPLVTTMSNNTGDDDQRLCQNLASNIFINIENQLSISQPSNDKDQENMILTVGHPAAELLIAKHHCALLRDISRSAGSAQKFLRAFNAARSHCESLVLVLSTLLVNPKDACLLKEVLATVSSLVKSDPKMAMDFLPLMLYASNRSKTSKIKFHILEFLPSLAAHKLMVSPVLKTILMLGNSFSVLPLATRLAKDLWRKQPRIFPYLLELLSKKVGRNEVSQDLWEELTISKATCILEICKLRPVQHGPDVIGLLARVFDEFEQGIIGTRTDVAESAVYLGLEALKLLCEAEVSDFQTAWAVVSSKVLPSQSAIVRKGVIRLLSITPRVLGKSTADVNLKKYACDFIWKHVNHENGNVSAAALASLNNFSLEDFIVEKLPPTVRSFTVDLLLRKHNLKKKDDDYDPSKEQISGPAYALLLQELSDEAAEGYGLLLTKILTKEVDMLPRNISSATSAKRLGSTYERFIDGIPDFLRSMYEKTNRPALIPGLAAGLLSCLKTSIQLGKNERTGRRHFIEGAKVNRQMLDNLLNEVSIEHTDWQHAVMAPTSWSKLMGRIYDVTLEGRKADLSLLFDQGRISSEAELKSEIESSAFWTRDELTKQLMRASKGNPTMQGNSIMALAGLAVKVSIEDAEKKTASSSQYTSKRDWLLKVADTVMVVLDGNFKPKGTPMQWCQQFSSNKSTASSLLSRASAAVALSEVAATLISIDLERIQQMTQLLIARIPGQEKAGKSSVIQFNSAIGLGMLMNRLQQQRFNDVIGQEGYLLSARALHVLENTAFDEGLPNREGAVFGFGLALSAAFAQSAKDSRVYARNAYLRLLNRAKILDNSTAPSLLDEGFYLALSVSSVSGFATDVIGVDTVSDTLETINSARKTHLQSFVLQAAYGILLHGAMSCGLSQVRSFIDTAIDSWLRHAGDQSNEVEERIADMHGLLNVFGGNCFIFQFDELHGFDAPLKNKLAVVIKTLQQVIESTDDASFCVHGCRLLGLLHLVHQGGVLRQTALPGNYNYLPDSSVLRCLYNCLVEAGKSGPRGIFSSSAVNSILTALLAVSGMDLPPVNWALVLSPLMKLGFDSWTRRMCLKFAVRIISSSATIPTWLLSWMNPSTFLSLDLECKKVILVSVDHITRFVPIHKMKIIIEELMVKTFLEEDACQEQKHAVLVGLKKIAELSNPIQSSLLCVKCALERFCSNETIIKDEESIKSVADCALKFPKELREDFMNNLKTTGLIIAVESAMVAHCGSPLKVMERTFELFSADPKNVSPSSLASLKMALQRHFLRGCSAKDHDDEVVWLLEQMGRISVLAVNKLDYSCHYWLEVLSSTFNIWSASGIYLPKIENASEKIYDTACWDLFGLQLESLLHSPSWQHLQEKVLEWLIAVVENYTLNSQDGQTLALLKDAIIQLRHADVWKSKGFWIKSLDCIANCEKLNLFPK